VTLAADVMETHSARRTRHLDGGPPTVGRAANQGRWPLAPIARPASKLEANPEMSRASPA
jgi:hypothetical protein